MTLPSILALRRRRRRHPRPLDRATTSRRSSAPAGSARARDIVVLEKSEPGAGASGIACGVVRNNYFQPAMSELMQACVEVWESDPAAYHYNPVGYMALGPAVQESAISSRPTSASSGSATARRSSPARREVDAYMKELFPDWRAQGRDGVPARAPGRIRLQQGLRAWASSASARSEGVADPHRRRGQGVRARHGRRRCARSSRARGRIEVGEQVDPGAGAVGASTFWSMLELPPTIDVRTPSGEVVRDRPMWTYWNLQEGEIQVDPTHVRARRRRRAAGDPPRHGRSALHGRRRARHRRALGDLLQARPPRRPGRRLAARRRRRRRARPVPVDDRRRPGLPRHVVRGALARDEPLRGLPAALQAGPLGRGRRVHGRQLPGVRLHEAERLQRSSTRTTATR